MCNNTYKLFLNFKTALYCSTLVMKLFNNSIESCFKPKLLLATEGVATRQSASVIKVSGQMHSNAFKSRLAFGFTVATTLP